MRLCILLIILSYSCFGQHKYIDDFFRLRCSVCSLDSISKEEINYKKGAYDWHKAHESFTKKNYKKANDFLLGDHTTPVYLRKLLQGYVFKKLKLDNEAEHLFRSVDCIDDEMLDLVLLKCLGYLYESKNLDSAFKYYEKVRQSKKTPIKLVNEVTESIAFLNVKKKNYKKAKFYYEELLLKYKNNLDSLALVRVYNSLGNLYFQQYEDVKARKYFDTAYVTSQHFENKKLKSEITHNLYIVSEALKEHKEAVQYLKEYKKLQDSIQHENSIWEIAQQKEAFNVEKKQIEINQKTKQRNVFVVFSVIVLLLLVAIFRFYKKLQLKHKQIADLNKELKETNALKNQIFSIVAHDLRSPVALLKQKFQLQKVNEEDETITIDKNVVSIIDSLSFLLDNLLNWSLSQSNLLHVQKDWFPLLPVVKQIEHQYKSLLQEKKIDFKIEHISSVLLFGDMELFKIVVRNCLDNAIKFTPIGGEITIFGDVENEFFKLSIQDSGVGIPEEVLKTLFELSAKKAQKDTQGRKSSGLGLHLVKSMITLNDGTIKIANNPKGGTIVNISVLHKMIA